jgi:NAD(P)-dependent dehydrogenase (short-subunit alcohol dehydrogenase family)
MRSVALDGAPFGVRANSVCPGFTLTPHLQRFFDASGDAERARRDAESIHPLGTLGDPGDVAEAFAYLAGPAGRWITGVDLPVDGGMTAGLWGGAARGAVPDTLDLR